MVSRQKSEIKTSSRWKRWTIFLG